MANMMTGKNDIKNILLVDDSHDLQLLLTFSLELEGYVVHAVDNGREGLDFLKNSEEPIDVVLLDLMMPVMDGVEFRKRQLEDPQLRDYPVVLLTAAPKSSIPDESQRLFDHTVLKPVNTDELLEKLAELSRRSA